jgi:hypothetical protein
MQDGGSTSDASSLTYKSLRLSSERPMLWHRGRCPTNWYQGQISYMWYLKSYTSGVIPIYEVMSIKMQVLSLNHLPQCKPLHQWEAHLFMKIGDKGGEIGTKTWNMQEALGRSWIWTLIWTKREQHWRMEKDKKFLDKRSTQVGRASSWTWLFTFDMCIFMCLLALYKFLNLICMLVCCMLIIELEWWYDN